MSTPTTSHVTYRHPQHSSPALTIDGVDVTHAMEAGFSIHVPDPGAPASLRVRVVADDFTFDGDATVTVNVPEQVRAALTAAGWTPPEGTDPRHGLRLEIVQTDPDMSWNGAPHFLRLAGRNGETVMHSENYVSRSNARRAAKGLAAKLGITTVREMTA
ncbi:YegP family protein [Janibacter terrae]|uniref:YegP family protein n=1 Tax=Janibacter terrae TaxID=103817 RepID=UPI0008337626|nr:YegP family protein [Janibacter terrae]